MREDAALAALIAADPVTGATRLIATLAARHTIVIDWREPSKMPTGVLGLADSTRRRITLPRFERATVPARLAVALHEVAHLLVPPCLPRVPPHRRPWRGGCLECERIAWARALTLWPFDLRMFDMLRDGLRAAIARYDAPAEAVAAARALTSPATFAEHVRGRERFMAALRRQAAAWASCGAHPCSVAGCRHRSGGLDDGDRPLCANHLLDSRAAAQRQWRARLRSPRFPGDDIMSSRVEKSDDLRRGETHSHIRRALQALADIREGTRTCSACGRRAVRYAAGRARCGTCPRTPSLAERRQQLARLH